MNHKNTLVKHSQYEITGMFKLKGAEHTFVGMHFYTPNYSPKDVVIPLAKIKDLSFKEYIPEEFFMGTAGIKSMQADIYCSIANKICEEHCIKEMLPQGYSFVNKKWVYVLGDTVINDVSGEYMPYNPDGLKIFNTINKDQVQAACKWCKLYCEHSHGLAATLFLCAITPYIRPVTEALQLSAKVVNALVVGPSGSGKTSYAKLVTNIFGNGIRSGVNLGSDKNEIISEICANYTDNNVLLDDLSIGSTSRQTEKRLDKLSEIIQLSECSGMAKLKGKSVDLSGTAMIITGEFLPPAASTINRCLVLEFPGTFDTGVLSELQRTSYLYSVFVKLFISWVCLNADLLVSEIRNILQTGAFDFNDTHASPMEYVGYMRITCSYKLLKITKAVFMKFSNCVMNIPVTEQRKLNSDFEKAISTAVSDTLRAVRRTSDMSDVIKVIIEIFHSDEDNIVAKKIGNLNKMVFRDEKYYYFRGKSLANYVGGKLGRDISVTALSRELSGAGLLDPFGTALTGRLKGDLKELSSKKFYRINIANLSQMVLDAYPDYFDRLNSPIAELRPKAYRE